MHRLVALAMAGALVLAAACAPPVAIRRDVRGAQQLATNNVLTNGEISRRTRNLLYDRDLIERYAQDPSGALASLHDDFINGRLQPGDAAYLSELNFHHAQHGGGGPYYLASALYAWRFLFPDDPKATPDRFNPRVRIACDLYNRGIARGLQSGDKVQLQAGSYPLPFGTLEISMKDGELQWRDHQLYDFFPAAELEVKGFETYYRWAGLGAPLAARVTSPEGERDLLGRRVRVPLTALLRPSDLGPDLARWTVGASLEV